MENRLDIWLVEKMGIKSRSKAQELIRGGYVLCNGEPVTKTGYKVGVNDEINLTENEVMKYVSRGGLKLEKAIREFGLDFKDKVILDIGSSTGGFTDCALKAGARKVIAVDVGTDVMDKTLRADSRVELYENTDIREFPYEKYCNIDFAVCDASFISLPVALKNLGNPGGDSLAIDCQNEKDVSSNSAASAGHRFCLIALIKPQFECGINAAKKFKGVVTDKALHREIIRNVLKSMEHIGFLAQMITWSPICGGDGNIEYIAKFIKSDNEGESLMNNISVSTQQIEELTESAFKMLKK